MSKKESTKQSDHWMIDPNWLQTAIVVSAKDGTISGTNQACNALIGNDFDTSSIQALFEPLHASLPDRAQADDVLAAIMGTADISFSDTLALNDGRVIDRRTRPLPDDHGRIWVLRDVTDDSLKKHDHDMHQTMLEDDAARNAELAEQLFHAKSELEHQQAELTRLANTDAMTGLLNRRRFISKATETIASIDDNETAAIWVIMLDIDHFKRINDTYGHSAGDAAICDYADVISGTVGDHGFVGRMGGEEFAVALPSADRDTAFRTAEKIRIETEANRTKTEQAVLNFTTSVGIAEWEAGETTLELALDRADKALYTAKDMGRNRVVGYE